MTKSNLFTGQAESMYCAKNNFLKSEILTCISVLFNIYLAVESLLFTFTLI